MTNPVEFEAPRGRPAEGETIVTSTCGHNCGGRCVVNAHVRNDRIERISTDARPWNPDHPPLTACARGVGQIERVYHPDRLQFPMRRTGPRGSGQYERISWDEALSLVSSELLRVRDTYGNASILDCSRSGSLSMLHSWSAAKRFLYMFGGCTDLWSNMSCEAEIFAVKMTYGVSADYKQAGREPTDFVNSKYILLWGWSPGDGMFGTGTMRYLQHAKQNGTRFVCVDPRKSRTSTALADEHVFIKPSTDAAALIAMAYVIVTEGLVDRDYCDRHVLGLDGDHLPDGVPATESYEHYLAGGVDGVPKTPEWASAITGVPAETIRRLAIEFATHKPAAIQCGYAGGRTAFGEQFHRAAYALAAMTGNVGIPGGNSGTSNGATGKSGINSLPTGANPINARVSSPLLADLLSRGRAGGYPADIKLIYSAVGDLFNQCPNINKIVSSLDKVEFIIGQDHFLTPTTRYADVVLPATTSWERNDVHTPWAGAGHYAIYMRQAIEPMYECRNDFDIFNDLAGRVGIENYSGKSEREWLQHLTKNAIGDFDSFTNEGLARFARPEDAVAFAKEIRDPANHRFTTPSGKIEIYSMTIAANPDPYGLGRISPIPAWVSPQESDSDLPFTLCSPKSRARTHSTHGNQPLLARVDPDEVWVNPQDASERQIADGSLVRIFNHRGETVLRARVTDKIAYRTLSVNEGAWHTPDANGIDRAGSINVLTSDRSAPSGATTYNSTFVDIAPAID